MPTQEEKQAAVNLFGNVYREATKIDSNVVGRSRHLNPIAPTVEKALETVLKSPDESSTGTPPPNDVYVGDPVPLYNPPAPVQVPTSTPSSTPAPAMNVDMFQQHNIDTVVKRLDTIIELLKQLV